MNTLKRLIRAGMIAAALSTSAVGAASLSACATTDQSAGHLNAARALYIAELSYSGFATSIVAAAHSGVLTGDKLSEAKAAEAKAYEALQLARQGRASADGVIDALNAAPHIPVAQ